MNHRQTTSLYLTLSSKVLNKCLKMNICCRFSDGSQWSWRQQGGGHHWQVRQWRDFKGSPPRKKRPPAPERNLGQFRDRKMLFFFLRCPKLSGNDYLINLFANPPAPGTPDPPASRIMTSMFEKTQEPMSAGKQDTHTIPFVQFLYHWNVLPDKTFELQGNVWNRKVRLFSIFGDSEDTQERKESMPEFRWVWLGNDS